MTASYFTQSVSKLYDFVLGIIKLPTARNIALVFFAGMVASGMGFATSILISRSLGPEFFGIYSMAILFVGMASQLADLGLNSGIVRFASPLIAAKDEAKANQVLYISLLWKIASSILSFGFLFLAARPLAIFVFHKPELYLPFQLASFGIFGILLLGFIGAVLQSYNYFVKKVSVDLFIGAAELILIIILIVYHFLTVKSSIIIYILGPLLGLVLGLTIAPKGYLKRHKWDKKLARQMFNFSKWITVSTLCTIFLSRMELLILGSVSNTYSTGLYAAAIQLATVVPVLIGAMTTVLFPKVATLKTIQEMRQYAKMSIGFSMVLIACFIPAIIFSKPLILLIFGAAYLPAMQLFRVVLFGYMFSIFINPLSLLMYTLNKPAYLAWVNIILIPISLLSNFILISQYGSIGAAFTSVIIRVLATIIIGLGIYYYLHRDKAFSLD